MQLLENRVYAGQPGERATVATAVEGGGNVMVFLDGAPVPADTIFDLKPAAGDETHLRVALFGAVGESCVVTIRVVNGGSDLDLLLCQISDPAPIHLYRFITTSAGAVRALKRARPTRRPSSPRAKRATASKARKRRGR